MVRELAVGPERLRLADDLAEDQRSHGGHVAAVTIEADQMGDLDEGRFALAVAGERQGVPIVRPIVPRAERPVDFRGAENGVVGSTGPDNRGATVPSRLEVSEG
jgi:hypothetical protein